jgi:hypothetical protein
VARLNWEQARRRELVRDRGGEPVAVPRLDPNPSRVKPPRGKPARRRRRRRRRKQLEMSAARPRSDWPARDHTREWVLAEYGEEAWRVVEEAMAKRVPA